MGSYIESIALGITKSFLFLIKALALVLITFITVGIISLVIVYPVWFVAIHFKFVFTIVSLALIGLLVGYGIYKITENILHLLKVVFVLLLAIFDIALFMSGAFIPAIIAAVLILFTIGTFVGLKSKNA